MSARGQGGRVRAENEGMKLDERAREREMKRTVDRCDDLRKDICQQ